MSGVIIRPVEKEDCIALYDLAKSASVGLTSLPKDLAMLERKVAQSLHSFQQNIIVPHDELYLFVMEDIIRKRIVGVCSIASCIGVKYPFHTFLKAKIKKRSWCVQKELEVDVLKLEKISNGPSEIGTLFLAPDYRKNGLGRLLSLSRFFFIAKHPSRFKPTIIAEMRGYSDSSGHSPFWTHAINPFFDMSFSQADLLSAENKEFISDLLPKHPIYINMLPDHVKRVIGKVHPNTFPALKILIDEGFEPTSAVDVFDSGPKVEINQKSLRIAQERRVPGDVVVKNDMRTSHPMIVCSGEGMDFRVSMGSVLDNALILSKDIFDVIGDRCEMASLYPSLTRMKEDLKSRFVYSKRLQMIARVHKWYLKINSLLMGNG